MVTALRLPWKKLWQEVECDWLNTQGHELYNFSPWILVRRIIREYIRNKTFGVLWLWGILMNWMKRPGDARQLHTVQNYRKVGTVGDLQMFHKMSSTWKAHLQWSLPRTQPCFTNKQNILLNYPEMHLLCEFFWFGTLLRVVHFFRKIICQDWYSPKFCFPCQHSPPCQATVRLSLKHGL